MDTKQLLSDSKYFESYARYLDDKGRYETWDEAVERVMGMHKTYYADKLTPELIGLLDEVEEAYKDKLFLGSQRALQFGGEQLLKNHSKLYNCTASYCDRVEVFGEIFHLMLSGCGVGFSVQQQHISKLPNLLPRGEKTVTYIVEDSIEGWASSVDVLLSSFFDNGGKHPEYHGYQIHFDLSNIRPKGSFISGGFKAPGPDGLRMALAKIELLLIKLLETSNVINSITVYDIIMHIADAVISGGVRRAATICLFSKEDTDMITAKTGDWYTTNPQRGRSNNSCLLLRNDTTKEEFETIMASVKEYGEPGFIWTDSLELLFNPCVEIGLYAKTASGVSGFSMCNLTEINGGKSDNADTFYLQCKVASIMGTLQAGYTDFKFLSPATKEIVDREALLGVSITGWMNNPTVLFDPDILKTGAEIAKQWNKITAKLIGINAAARVTTVKPSGNASVLLGTASGIHGEHSKRYLRHVQFNKETEIAKAFLKHNPKMCEQSVWGTTDIVVAFPITPKEGSIYKKDLLGVKQLEYVVKAQRDWVNNGRNDDLCVMPFLKHNVSNTITVDDWDNVSDFIYDNRNFLGGVSLLAAGGDKSYPQAPFTEVFTYDEIVSKYGENTLFTSALIEAGLTAFNNDLWAAINTALGYGEQLKDSRLDELRTKLNSVIGNEVLLEEGEKNSLYESINNAIQYSGVLGESSIDLLKRDFVRRFNKFAKRFESAHVCADCLKDVYNLHKWSNIQLNFTDVDWLVHLTEKKYVDVNTLAAQACSGGKCDI